MNLRFGWIESKFLDFTRSNVRIVRSQGNPPPPPRIFEVPIEYTGNRLPNTPRFKLSGSAEYAIDLGRYGSLIPRYDFSWTDDVFFDPSEGRGAPNNDGELFLPDYTIGQKAYWLHNARLTYRTPGGNLEVAGWVRNLTDETYKTLSFDASAAAGLVGNLVGDPRTYGISLSVSF
jgi:iron complex outermembrane receptor protein